MLSHGGITPPGFFLRDSVVEMLEKSDYALYSSLSSVGGRLDLLDNIKLPYPSGPKPKHRWEAKAELNAEWQVVDRQSTKRKPKIDLLQYYYKKMKYLEDNRRPGKMQALPTALYFSFLKDFDKWPDNVREYITNKKFNI